MRSIDVTMDVYAAIWAARHPGEDTEAEILTRLLKVKAAPRQPSDAVPRPVGFRDSRFDISFPEGFEIFRNYKGIEFRARATGGAWLLVNTGATYPSLNQLSPATSGNTENAWRNWYFTGRDGRRHLIEKLRNDITPNARHQM